MDAQAAKRKRTSESQPESFRAENAIKRIHAENMVILQPQADLNKSNVDDFQVIGNLMLRTVPFYPDPIDSWNPTRPRLFHGHFIPTGVEIVVKAVRDTGRNKSELVVLERFQGSPYSPRFDGSEISDGYLYMGIEKLRTDLYDLQRKLEDSRFSYLAAARLIMQLVEALEHFHKMGVVHGDIKPSNLMLSDMRSNSGRILKLVDYGLVHIWRDERRQTLQPKYAGHLIGTVRYASLDVHRNMEPTRKDDFVSLIYSLFEMVFKELPWTELEILMATDYEKAIAEIVRRKLDPANSLQNLMKQIGPEWVEFAEYVENLDYNVTPDYSFLKNCCKRFLERNHFNESIDLYDWIEERVVM